MNDKATWRELIKEEMEAHADNGNYHFEPMNLDLDKEFDFGYGCENGVPFHLWTETRVYFVVCYDGAEWVGSVPRHPSKEKPVHHGGG